MLHRGRARLLGSGRLLGSSLCVEHGVFRQGCRRVVRATVVHRQHSALPGRKWRLLLGHPSCRRYGATVSFKAFDLLYFSDHFGENDLTDLLLELWNMIFKV